LTAEYTITDPDADPNTDPDADPNTDPDADPGTDPDTDPGTDPTDPGTDPTGPGADPANPGESDSEDPTDPGADPGSGVPAISAADDSIMAKGATRQFTASGFDGTVEGRWDEYDELDTKSDTTTIDQNGLLTVAADETNITLTVTATDGSNTETAAVKVKGWMPVNLMDSLPGFTMQKIAYGAIDGS
jgi:hypothetical protein